MNARDAIATARAIVIAMKNGAISYDNAKTRCQPYFNVYNKYCKKIAKKYNQRPHKISFSSFAR